MALYSVDKRIIQARKLAADYRAATGKPLPGVSSEIAEYDAARLLDLELRGPGERGGFDAVGRGEREGRRVQINGRGIFDEQKGGQRIGQLKLDQEWDSVVLVLMDADYEPMELYEALREEVLRAVKGDGESGRGKRGAMSVNKFKNIATLVWSRDNSDAGEVWDNQSGD